MESSLYWVVVIPLMLVLSLAAVLLLLKLPARVWADRRRRMAALAESLGLRYYGDAEAAALSSLPDCLLLRKGAAKALGNLMAAPGEPPRALVFDYGHAPPRRGVRDPQWGCLHLVVMLRLPPLSTPAPVMICRQDWFGGPVGVKGLYSLDFKEDPGFSSQYLVKGRPRLQVRALLGESLREALKAWTARGPKPIIEVLPDWLVAYVESDPADRDVARKGARFFHYAAGIAAALAEQARG